MVQRRLRGRKRLWKDSLILPAVLGIGLAVLFIHTVNAQIRPIMIQLAIAQAHNDVVEVLTKTVEQIPLSYDEIITLEKGEAGQITALKSDMSAVNTYRSQLLERLVSNTGELQKQHISIPLGTLTGIELLSGRGPGIPVKVLTIGQAESSFENVFSSAGINQTRHQIMLNLTVTASVLMPGVTTQTDITTQICVAETVIVGNVPEHFTYFSQFDTAKEASDHYFDYDSN